MISAAAGAPRSEASTATRTRSIVVVGRSLDQLGISPGTRLCIICRYISDILLPDNGSDAALAAPPSPALTATMHHHRGGSRHAQASHFYQTLVTRHVSHVLRCSRSHYGVHNTRGRCLVVSCRKSLVVPSHFIYADIFLNKLSPPEPEIGTFSEDICCPN